MNKFHSWDKKGVIRFAIIYKNTTVREGEVCSDVTGESYIAFPNFFTEYTTIFIPSSKGRVKVNVFNSSGQLTESTDEEGKFEPGAKYAERIYFVNLVILKNLRQ